MRVEWACLGELDEEGVVQRVVDFSVRCEELPEQRRDVREMLALERPSRQIPGLQHIGSECTVGTRVGATVGRGGGGGGGGPAARSRGSRAPLREGRGVSD